MRIDRVQEVRGLTLSVIVRVIRFQMIRRLLQVTQFIDLLIPQRY